jgi:hypothetical protein
MDYKMEYEKAINEIKILKITLSKVCGYEYTELPDTLSLPQLTLEHGILYCRIKKLESLLDEQYKINESYQIEIIQLNDKIDHLNDEVGQLKINNKNLNDEVGQLKINNKNLNDNINKLLEKEEIDNLMVAIQDINRKLQLEQKVKNSSLSNLRIKRNESFHYILDDEPPELTDAKITILYEKLKNLKDNIRKKMNRQYPNVIRDVLSHIKPVQNIPEQALDEATEWWD